MFSKYFKIYNNLHYYKISKITKKNSNKIKKINKPKNYKHKRN